MRKEQIDWYVAADKALEQANGGAKLPTLAFQHIIVPEIYEIFPRLWREIPGISMTFLGVPRLLAPNFFKFRGAILERPCPPYFGEGQFDAWLERGNVVAAIFGHDHTNNFTAPIRGIDLVGCPGTAYYMADVSRGATLFTLDESDPWSYAKENINYRKAAAQSGSAIQIAYPDAFLDKIGAWFDIAWEMLLTWVMGAAQWNAKHWLGNKICC